MFLDEENAVNIVRDTREIRGRADDSVLVSTKIFIKKNDMSV